MTLGDGSAGFGASECAISVALAGGGYVDAVLTAPPGADDEGARRTSAGETPDSLSPSS